MTMVMIIVVQLEIIVRGKLGEPILRRFSTDRASDGLGCVEDACPMWKEDV